MAFISSSSTSSGKSKVPTVQGASTASAQVPTVRTDVATASLSYDTVCAFIDTQPNGSQVKYKDISQIDDDGIEEIDIKWNLALLSMRADRSSRSQDRGKRENYKKDPKVEETAPKAMIAIDEEVLTEYALMAKSNSSSDNEKDLSWMGLPEFVDDIVTDYTRPTPSINISKSISKEKEERWKSNHPSLFEQGGSFGNVVPKPMIKFVKESGCPNATKVNNTENARKPTVKYAEMYKNTSQSPRVKGNQRNCNNQKSQQLGKNFMMQNKACYNCGSFDHLEFNCNHNTWVAKEKTWSK
nr:ubiquitin hydrolase [Tanacetum cinerariifolium]